MKIADDLIEYIRVAAKTARGIGIDSILFEKNLVRGMDDNSSVFICQTRQVPSFDFDSIAITRLDLFMSRYALLANRVDANTSVEVNVIDGTSQVSQITFKAKGIKIEFRCASYKAIKAVKSVKDPMNILFNISTDTLDTLIKAQSAMSADMVTIISDPARGLRFELTDSNNDVFSYDFSEPAIETTNGDVVSFVHRYRCKQLILLLKQSDNGVVAVNEKGILRVQINNLDTFIFPIK